MIDTLLKDFKNELDKIIAFAKNEFNALRTSRPTPALVEDLPVELYGQTQPLKHVAAISVTLPNMIIMKPWDKQAVEPITRAIGGSNLSLNPVVEKDVVKIILPALTQERKEQLIKALHQKAEEGRIAIRVQRDEWWKKVQKMEKDKTINEDDKFRAKEKLQKIVDEANTTIESLGSSKEKEIMEL